jgi:hypothetical protein
VKKAAELAKAFTALGQDADVASLPSPELGDELNTRIGAANTPQKRQAVISEVQRAYGIGGHGDTIEYAPGVDEEAITEPDRAPQIGSHVFTVTNGPLAHLRMALTLNHENLHRQQYKRIGETSLAYAPGAMTAEVRNAIILAAHQEAMLREILAYESELSTIASYRATFYSDEEPPEPIEAELQKFEVDATEERDDHFARAQFTHAQQALFEANDFAALLISIRKHVPDGTTRYSLSAAEWDDVIDATAMLEQMKAVAAKRQIRDSRYLRQKWDQLDRALETRFYRAKLAHWWLVRTPEDMATLDVHAEVEKILVNAEFSRPPDFWARVAASPWAPRDDD